MRVALLAPFEESVPPSGYGGTELIVYYLAQNLTLRGHSVFLFATGDSKTKAKLVPIFPSSLRKKKICQDLKVRETLKYFGVVKLVQELKKIKVDIIHNHLGWRFLPFASFFSAPTLTTLHQPLNSPYLKIAYQRFKNFPFVAISHSQRKNAKGLNFVGTVYNGVDTKELRFCPKPKSDYFAFLARMSPEKGPLEAILAAKKAKAKLKMAGKVDAVDKEYFEKKVKPLIDGKQIQFVGELKVKEKSNFLGNAKGLLAPLKWEEPFGLFMIEAMACGTPVIAFKRGSAPELTVHKKTGFLVKNVSEMAQAIKKIDSIDRRECRDWVEKNFTVERMVQEYEKIYEKVVLQKT